MRNLVRHPKKTTKDSGTQRVAGPKQPFFTPTQAGDCFFKRQAKLSINTPADAYEQEADQVAEQVMGMSEPGVSPGMDAGTKPVKSRVQRMDEDDEERLQAKQTPASSPRVTPAVTRDIQSLRGQGTALPASSRAFFEPRFGTRFNDIRIHNDSRANQLAGQVKARAFTLGHDIVFGQGQYQPSSREGRRLMAHELTHVVQQSGSNQRTLIQREQTTRARPWQEVNARFADRAGHRMRLFSHDFAASTSLANALQWIFDNSIARPTSFQFVSERETIETEAYEASLRRTGQPVSWYQEVALVWHLRRRRFRAYTTRHPASAATDPRQRQQNIFVAHTHPTQTQVPGGTSSGVTWQTTSPSPEDAGNFHPRQTVSIICHRDPADNQTPMTFVYNQSGGVLARYRGAGAFQSAATEFERLERDAGTLGSGVGHYPRRRRRP